ncbi:LAMI_0E14378g1_1 [Lachancea mirantina]|uniref:LAMI_0E14378g1_1 n=1 Tax=Lachancea mirantina TaxID=1230905 RepID=A0A1G4JRK2_9SACH|nr:LAMI_0E14378g1_1 [Lachancea mirantina]
MEFEEAVKDIFCGSVAGALGKVVEYPFDTVKVRLQTQPTHMFPNAWSCIKYTYANEGLWRGFYQGLGSPVSGAALENAVLFVAFNRASHVLEHHTSLSQVSKSVWAGAFAGACASFVLTPVELVKCRLQVSNLTKVPGAQSKIWPTVKSILAAKGLAGLWQGQSGTFVRETGGGAVWFTTYEIVKELLAARRQSQENHTWELLVAGACAGVGFNASTFPADTIKSTMQTRHDSFMNTTKTILARQGISGFYRGLGITLVRAVPSNAIIFYTYESLSSYLHQG